MRKKSLLPLRLAILFLILNTSVKAQYTEVGSYVGLSNYMGELSEQRLAQNGYGGMIGVFGRQNFTKFFSAKASLTKGTISGNDEFAKLETNRMRNLSFRSDVLEVSITGEANLLPYNIRDRKTGVPYVFAGIAATYFNPQAQMRGAWYNLQPLRTEGKKYSRCTVAVPFGLGMKFNLSYKLNIGFEAGARKTFTDYLDDVSTAYPNVLALRQTNPVAASLAYRTPEVTGSFGENPIGAERGNATNKDWYFFGGVTVSVNLTDKYGLDFDKKYEEFKTPKPEKKEELTKRKKKASYQKKLRLWKKKKMLEPQAKKRTK